MPIERDDLERWARDLGRDADESVDSRRVAWQVLARLQPEARSSPWVSRLAWAALVTLVVGAGWIVGGSPASGPSVTQAIPWVGLGDIDALSEDELTEVLDRWVDPAIPAVDPVKFHDLNEEQLQMLLVSLEG